jgi:hypothetical protein
MSKPLTRQILERARDLIADKNHWCRGSLAKDVGGRQVDPWDSTAMRRCAYGALIAAAFELVADSKQARDLADAVAKEIHGSSWLITTNDIGGHGLVLALFDKCSPTARWREANRDRWEMFVDRR